VQLAQALLDPSCLVDAPPDAAPAPTDALSVEVAAPAEIGVALRAILKVRFKNEGARPLPLHFAIPPRPGCDGEFGIGDGVGRLGPPQPDGGARPEPCGFHVSVVDSKGAPVSRFAPNPIPPSADIVLTANGPTSSTDVPRPAKRVVRIVLAPGGEATADVFWRTFGFPTGYVERRRDDRTTPPPLPVGAYRVTVEPPLVGALPKHSPGAVIAVVLR